MLGCLSLYCFLVFGPPGAALDPGLSPAPAAAGSSVQAFGRAATCSSWSDGCTVCTRQAGGGSACSLPGIACTPGPVACSSP